MKFCPRCGSPRIGKFCESCGFEFPFPITEQKVAETPTFATPVPLGSQGQQATKEESAPSLTTEYRAPGWYPDPLQERLWDGEAWTELVRPVSTQRSTEKSLLSSDKPKPKTSSGPAKQPGLPSKVLLEGLEYGSSFEPGSSCYNCGQHNKMTVKACTTCGVNY